MIVIFPLLVSKNVNTNLVQGLAVTLEQYIASYAISDFIGKSKEFNKYYNYKMKGGKIYQESDISYFDIDPVTQSILAEQGKKSVPGIDPEEELPEADPTKGTKRLQTIAAGMTTAQDAVKQMQNWRRNKDKHEKPIQKPTFSGATIHGKQISLEPTWVEVALSQGGSSRLGIKVIPMMIEGFNIKHTISTDMQKYFLDTFIAGIGRKVMRLVYRLIDRWTFYGNRPRGDVRHDMFYARTGHDGQPFVLLDKNEDIPKIFFSQPQNMLKLWKLSWGNLLIADDATKTVMFCMKKYKGMCSNFTYGMIFAQSKEMAKVFEDMEDARKATSSLFRFNKKITSMGGRR